MQKLINILKDASEDFEFYPTTGEIIEAVCADLSAAKNSHDEVRFARGKEAMYNAADSYRQSPYRMFASVIGYCGFNREKEGELKTFLDIGAGNGGVFDKIENAAHAFGIETKMAVEKSDVLADLMVAEQNIAVVGRDFFNTNLFAIKADVTFSNPPYSIYEPWVCKILKESTSKVIYLVIPERWENNDPIRKAVEANNWSTEVIGEFDFADGERAARAKVHLIRVVHADNTIKDPFEVFIEENIGKFEKNEEPDFSDDQDPKFNEVLYGGRDGVESLVNAYNAEMNAKLEAFREIAKIDMNLLEQIGVNRESVLASIKGLVTGLKTKYWDVAMNNLGSLTSRLTYKNREAILQNISWIKNMDFNEGNIRTLVIWVINHYQEYTEGEIRDLFKKLVCEKSANAYKSNKRWCSDEYGWRYNQKLPEKIALDYRFVAPGLSYGFLSQYNYGVRRDNVIIDILIIAGKLGFDVPDWVALMQDKEALTDCKHTVYYANSNKVFMTYRVYKNQNMHFQFDPKFMQRFNIEAG